MGNDSYLPPAERTPKHVGALGHSPSENIMPSMRPSTTKNQQGTSMALLRTNSQGRNAGALSPANSQRLPASEASEGRVFGRMGGMDIGAGRPQTVPAYLVPGEPRSPKRAPVGVHPVSPARSQRSDGGGRLSSLAPRAPPDNFHIYPSPRRCVASHMRECGTALRAASRTDPRGRVRALAQATPEPESPGAGRFDLRAGATQSSLQTSQSQRSQGSIPPPKFHQDQINTWNENIFRMGSSHGSRLETSIDRLPLPQELLEHMAVQTSPHGSAASPGRSDEGGDRAHKGRGFVTLDGAYSDGYREDNIFPKLFPRNKPGGVEWQTLKMSLTRTLKEATRHEQGAEELLHHVFRTAFHEIYRRLPLFRGAVIHSEKDFKHLQAQLTNIHEEKEREAQALRDELTEVHTAVQVWRIRALRAESRAERSHDEVAKSQMQVDEFKKDVEHNYLCEKLDHEKLKTQYTALANGMELLKVEHGHELQQAVEKLTHEHDLNLNEALMKQLADFNEKESDLRGKIAAAESSAGDKLLQNGKLSTRIKNMNSYIDKLEKCIHNSDIDGKDKPERPAILDKPITE